MLLSVLEHSIESDCVVPAGIILGSKVMEVVCDDEPRSAFRDFFFPLKKSWLGNGNRSGAAQTSPE